jgi:hypothetical protein
VDALAPRHPVGRGTGAARSVRRRCLREGGRSVVIDLLPLYASGEASADTKTLVEAYIKEDASLRALLGALQGVTNGVGADAEPSRSLEREALNRTHAVIRRRSWLMGLGIFLTVFPMSVAQLNGVTYILMRDFPQSMLSWVIAAGLWWKYVALSRRLRVRGL